MKRLAPCLRSFSPFRQSAEKSLRCSSLASTVSLGPVSIRTHSVQSSFVKFSPKRFLRGSLLSLRHFSSASAPQQGAELPSQLLDLFAADKFDEAAALFQAQRRGADLFSYNLMLAAMSDRGDVAGMQRLYDEMRVSSAARPDEETALEMLGGLPELSQKLAFYEQWQTDAFLDPPSVRVFNGMLLFLSANGRGAEAVQRFESMASHRLKPDSTTYAIVASALANQDPIPIGRLRTLADEIWQSGIQPLPALLFTLVAAFGRSGHVAEAKRYFEMVPPDEWTPSLFSAMIEAHMVAKDTDSMQKYAFMIMIAIFCFYFVCPCARAWAPQELGRVLASGTPRQYRDLM
eukprot:TRINITY_DN9049_c0_g1_i1.p1 TRINITY_DN9049_c0_g1~~TRINITY_DN9049_c0_g1_i1.p1  ORF type:complete len:347 (-),score=68.00 TRINITY_DN9049_c0_g1_i1:38-1078(-)